MKQFLLFILLLISLNASAQYYQQFFEYSNNLPVRMDENPKKVWQIGSPNKTNFNMPFSPPNVMVTDTVNTYPVNSLSRFSFAIPVDSFGSLSISAIEWTQQIDAEFGKDGGIVEFSLDDSTWMNAFNNPYVYSFYGYDPQNVDTLSNGQVGFTGFNSNWHNVWLCYDFSWFPSTVDSVRIRFSFTSDSVDTNQDGWILDNFLIHTTIIHTVSTKVEEEKSMTIFPVPSNGMVTIRSKDGYNIEHIDFVKVIDGMGKIVGEYHDLDNNTSLNLTHLPVGAYFLKIKTNISTEIHRLIITSD